MQKGLVIIPAYNEQKNILDTVNDVKQKASAFDYIIINDCSSDNTLDICAKNNFNVIDLAINLGIGGAVQTGYLYAFQKDYDIAVQFDGDGQHDAAYLNRMAQVMQNESLDMLIGSRFINNEGFQSSGIRRMGIRFFSTVISCLFGKKITDPTSGMRMCNRKVIELFSESYPRDYAEPETTAMLLRMKYKVGEMPVIMKERKGGVSSISPLLSCYYMLKVTLSILIERCR